MHSNQVYLFPWVNRALVTRWKCISGGEGCVTESEVIEAEQHAAFSAQYAEFQVLFVWEHAHLYAQGTQARVNSWCHGSHAHQQPDTQVGKKVNLFEKTYCTLGKFNPVQNNKKTQEEGLFSNPVFQMWLLQIDIRSGTAHVVLQVQIS